MIDHLSASSLSRWRRCHHEWYLRYVRGIITPPSRSQQVGTAVHEYLARILRAGIDLGVEWRRDEWRYRAAAEPLPDDPAAAQLAGRLRDHVIATWDQPLGAEVPVREERDGYVVLGFVDAITRGSDARYRQIVRELKTTTTQRAPQWDRHAIQVATYAWLTRTHCVVVSHVSPVAVRTAMYRVLASDIDAIARAYDDAWSGITRGDWTPAVGRQCRWCDVRGHCSHAAQE